jgi:hypothetical protein
MVQVLSQHVSAIHCHYQGVVFTSEATQTISVLWMYMDYHLFSVAVVERCDQECTLLVTSVDRYCLSSF